MFVLYIILNKRQHFFNRLYVPADYSKHTDTLVNYE